jgi:hypothetical protein
VAAMGGWGVRCQGMMARDDWQPNATGDSQMSTLQLTTSSNQEIEEMLLLPAHPASQFAPLLQGRPSLPGDDS